MIIRKSKIADLPKIMQIYDRARQFMAENGNPNQWGNDKYPSIDLIKQDIKSEKSYVCEENGDIVGTFFFDFGKDIEPTYEIIEEGNWEDHSAYGVIHRLASNFTTKGIGKKCFEWAYKQSNGHIRVDTHKDNKPLQNLLKKLEYKYCGIIFVRNNSPRLAYEKFK